MNNTDVFALSICRWHTVKAVTGLSRSTCWRLMKTGDFPQSVKLSSRAVGWRKTDIEKWVSSRIQQSSTDMEGITHE